jgi:DNA-directed RNA polymerase II subunit RPB2
MNGTVIQNKIFICPTYYQRLKHMVNDKIHARARGPLTSLTRQPPEGRSKDGGAKFGEMERDCMIAHGASKFLKERMMEASDKYTIHICEKCGMFAQRVPQKNSKLYASDDDIYKCIYCNNDDKITKTNMPYAFKLLLQELMSIGIEARLSFQ